MDYETLGNGIRIFKAPQYCDERLMITSWGAEYDTYIGIYHLLEHIIVEDVTKVIGQTDHNFMNFIVSDDDGDVCNVVNLFYDSEHKPLLATEQYEKRVREIFSRELDSIENEKLFRLATNDNIIDYFIYGTWKAGGDKNSLSIPLDKFCEFVKKQWLTLEPTDLVFIVNEQNYRKKLQYIEKTFGKLAGIMGQPKSKPYLPCVFDFNTFTIDKPFYPTVSIPIKNPNLVELYSYLSCNKNIRLDRVVNNSLLINLNPIMPYPNEITLWDIYDGLRVNSDQQPIERIDNNLLFYLAVFKNTNFPPFDVDKAEKFANTLCELVASRKYILTLPSGNFDGFCINATKRLLADNCQIIKHNQYNYAMYKLPIFLTDEILDQFGEYTRQNSLAYNFTVWFNDKHDHMSIIGTNTLDNKKLYIAIQNYFQVSPITMLSIEK